MTGPSSESPVPLPPETTTDHIRVPADPEALGGLVRAQLQPRSRNATTDVAEILAEYLRWGELQRMIVTTKIIPPAHTCGFRLVDIGGTVFWLPLYRLLGYRHISVVGRPGGGFFEVFDVPAGLSLELLDGDAELERLPVDDGSARCLVCFEVLEHFAGDPMHCIAEVNRILVADGVFCLTTPNVLSSDSLAKMMLGEHPFGWSVFTDSYADRHNREYTPFEVRRLLECGGFSVTHLETADTEKIDTSPSSWKRRVLGFVMSLPAAMMGRVPLGMRNGRTFVQARKMGSVRERFPEFLYNLYGKTGVTVRVRPPRLS